MPGIAVAVGSIALERFRSAVRKLEHIPAHRSYATSIGPELAIGWAGSPERLQSQSWRDGQGGHVDLWRYGHTFRDGVKPGPVDASEILRAYLDGGIEACFDYEGSFSIVVADTRSNRLYIVPDRLGTHPLYYTRRGDDIVIGPEVKVLATALNVVPRFSQDAVVGFLSVGYNLGDQTIFGDIKRLELGQMLEISLDVPRKLAARRFWKIDYDTPDKLTNRHDAEDALFEAIKQGHRVLLSDKPAFQLLLSGGADSRGILGTCSTLGMLPGKAVTWGLMPDLPRSDASVSRTLAEHFGVSWDFIVTRTDDFIDNCEKWAYVSELSSDNFGWYAEGFTTLNYMHDMGYSCSFIGDEVWGWLGFAYDEAQAHARVVNPSVPSSVLELLREPKRETVSESYSAHLRSVMRDCTATDWDDRKDFLYLHGRVARFVFALGYYRGLGTEQRRPFLTRAVLDVVRRLPAEFRVRKNLYRTMLKRHLPETMRVPCSCVDSLPDWGYDLRAQGPLSRCFREILQDPDVETGVLGELFDTNRFGAVRDAYFAGTPVPVGRMVSAKQLLKRQIKQTMWCSPAYKYIDPLMHERSGASASLSSADLLRRVAVIVLLERQLERLASAPAPAMDAISDDRQGRSVH